MSYHASAIAEPSIMFDSSPDAGENLLCPFAVVCGPLSLVHPQITKMILIISLIITKTIIIIIIIAITIAAVVVVVVVVVVVAVVASALLLSFSSLVLLVLGLRPC